MRHMPIYTYIYTYYEQINGHTKTSIPSIPNNTMIQYNVSRSAKSFAPRSRATDHRKTCGLACGTNLTKNQSI